MALPSLANIAMFVLAGLALNVTPGPDMLYTATRTMAQGRRAGIASALGISTGCLVHIFGAALGVSAVLAYSATAYQVIKWAGAAYLVYLGIRALTSGNGLSLDSPLQPKSMKAIYWQGVFTNVLNPKVALFFLSFLPQFVNHERGETGFQMIFLGSLFICTGTMVLLAVVLSVNHFADNIRRRPNATKWLRWFTGSVFIALGAKLALSERR